MNLKTKIVHFAGSLLLTLAIFGTVVAAGCSSEQNPPAKVPQPVVDALDAALALAVKHADQADPRLAKAVQAVATVRLWQRGQVSDAEGRAALREFAGLLGDVAADLRARGVAVPPSVDAILAFAAAL
jgi:hypothetical protein